MGAYRHQKRCCHLLGLPQELLQLILNDVPGKYTYRTVCKAFANALATSCDSILLRRTGLLVRGPRCEVAGALVAFPNARRVVLDLGGGQLATRAITSPGYDWDLNEDFLSDGRDGAFVERSRSSNAYLTPTRRGGSSHCDRGSSTSPAPAPSDEDLICETASELRGRGITSLALLQLSCPPPPPSVLAILHPTLLELELSDASYALTADHGAFNLLVREGRDICARGDALIQLAVSQPQLRRLSLSSAAFSVGGVATLGVLTRLESLSVVGCVECPGAAPQAAETYRSLLRELSSLRQLRLPMAVASPSTTLLDDDDVDGGGDGAEYEVGDDEENGGYVFGGDGGRGGGAVAAAGFFGGLYGDGSGGAPRLYLPSSADSWRSSLHATVASGWLGDHLVPADPRSNRPPAFPPGPGSYHEGGAASLAAGAAALSELQQPAAEPPLVCPLMSAPAPAAAFAGPTRPPAPGRQKQLSQLAAGFIFPPKLQDLTIPLCSLNRPLFEAVCAAFAASAEGEGSRVAAFGSVGGLSSGACGAPSRRGCAHCGVAANDGGVGALDACFREACCCCYRGGGVGGAYAARRAGNLRSLHVPTLAGYSHWEGSFLSSAHDFEQLSRLAGLEQLHLSLDVGAFRMSRAGLRACFQKLRALRHLSELRITEAQRPTSFLVRKRSAACHLAPARGFGASKSALSGPALLQLQRQWPELHTLQFFSETIVRSGGRLMMPDGIDDVDLLPAPCACCTAPYLMAAPPSSVGRWGRGEPGWSPLPGSATSRA